MARCYSLPDGVSLGLWLDRYQELMRLPEAAFNGLDRDEDGSCYDCSAVWKQTDRDGLALAIRQAEDMREKELGYHVVPRYLAGEEVQYSNPIILSRKMLIKVGVETTVDIQSGVVVNLGTFPALNDPVSITVATTVTDTSEIAVYYPGEAVRIKPSSVSIAGGSATILIPRSRLVNPTVDTNCDPAPRYDDNANFLTTVDVKRVYIDQTTGAFYVWIGNCGCSSSLSETTQLCYPHILNSRTSGVELIVASYTGGSWRRLTNWPLSCDPTMIRISYLSGRSLNVQTELETARLANSLLPRIMPDRVDMCGRCWKGDMEVDKSGLWTPYGNSVAAISVWMADSRSKVGSGGKF